MADKELASAKAKARGGNGKEAFAVFIHYAWGLHDHTRGEPWLRLALKNGNRSARGYIKQWQIAQPADYARFAKGKAVPKGSD